jgi:hypothetical protein
MLRQSPVDQRNLIDLLCTEMTETARAEKLGIARSSYYKQLDKLTREGVLVNRGTVLPCMRLSGSHPRSRHSGTHHAPVLHIWWEDSADKWSVQGALLDDWDRRPFKSLEFGDTAVAIRWLADSHQSCFRTAFVARPRARWSTQNTEDNLPASWLPLPQPIRSLTIAIARVLDAETVIIPEDL